MNDYILIEYKNSVDLGDESTGVAPILYHNGFTNRVYLKADVSKPEYELVEEGIEDGHQEFTPTFKKWAKRYSVEFYAQEYMADALTLMDMHDNIVITLRNGESSLTTDLEVDVDWDGTIECWAKITIKFTTDYMVMTKCSENFDYSCLSPVQTASTSYDADDGGAGQTAWENPLLHQNKIYFFYKTTNLCQGYGGGTDGVIGVYKSIGGEWVMQDVSSGEVIEVSDFSNPTWLVRVSDSVIGYIYNRVPYICSVTDQTGGVAKVIAYSTTIETTFFQVQTKEPSGSVWSDVGDPQLASAFDTGFDVTTGAANFDFRLHWYTHTCDYGYSNTVTQTIT